MLTSARKGKPVNEEEMPPPVALGGKANVTAESEPIKERELPQPELMPSPPTNQKPLREAPPPAPNAKPMLLTPPQKQAVAITPETPAISPLTPSQPDAQHSGKHTQVLLSSWAFNHSLFTPIFFFLSFFVWRKKNLTYAPPPFRAQTGSVGQTAGVQDGRHTCQTGWQHWPGQAALPHCQGNWINVDVITQIHLFVCVHVKKKSQNSILKELTSLHSEAGHAGGGDRRRRTSRPELTASSPWSV